MFRLKYIFIFLILVLAFFLVLPGAVFAQEKSTISSNSNIVIEVPEQAETGQTITLIARVRENEHNEPVKNAPVVFFIVTDFFIRDLVQIGEAVSDEYGLAKLDYIPNQPGDMLIVASYRAGSNFEPAVAEKMVNIVGSSKSFYRTLIGIQFPHSLIIWLASIVLVLSGVYGIFLFVIFQVNRISRGAGAKGVWFILMAGVTVLFIVIVVVLVTQESQFNFGLLP